MHGGRFSTLLSVVQAFLLPVRLGLERSEPLFSSVKHALDDNLAEGPTRTHDGAIMHRALAILENSSRWPTWLDSQALDGVDLITQRPGEDSIGLARRVVQRLTDGLPPPSTAILACNAVGGARQNRARAALLRGLLSSMARAGGGHVVLAADGSQTQRRELIRLAAALNREISDEPRVSLRFRAFSRQFPEARQRDVA